MMYFNNFSKKQLQVLSWWMSDSPYKDCDAIICDGAIRAGKTVPMSLSFIIWAMSNYTGQNFGIAGKSVKSCTRNVINPMMDMLETNLKPEGYTYKWNSNDSELTVSIGKKTNTFYVYGGKDERSYTLIQGITLAGILLDEVALMPQSFVEQAISRCSVEGSKFWFNCNPEGPNHWIYLQWILDAKQKNAYHIHFDMVDNPSLSDKMIQRYHNLYKGVFYDRMVLGKWVKAEGLVYPMFNNSMVFRWKNDNKGFEPDIYGKYKGRWIVSVDYGTRNPFSAGLWYYLGGIAYRTKEYYYNSKAKGNQLTDEEYYNALEKVIGDKPVESIIVDPSAASFRELVYRKGKYVCHAAKNNVQDGIRHTATALNTGSIKIHESCVDSIREFSLYTWDDKALDDKPIKENDHAMDDIRYFCENFLAHEKAWD